MYAVRRTALVASPIASVVLSLWLIPQLQGHASSGTAPHSLPVDSVHRAQHWESAAAARDEYVHRTAQLSLPAGANWPASASSIPANAGYEVGWGDTVAELHWWCSWEQAWLAAKPHSDARSADTAQLTRIRGMQLYRVASDHNTKLLTEQQLAAAASGDPGPLQRDVSLNCQQGVGAPD